MAIYRNPFHEAGKPHYGPAQYETDATPTPYRGMLIYRRMSVCWDVVKDDTCIGQYAGMSGAKGLIDTILDTPDDWWAKRALSWLKMQEA